MAACRPIDADPGELRNVAIKHPDVVARIEVQAQSYVRELDDEGQVGRGVRKAGYANSTRPMNAPR